MGWGRVIPVGIGIVFSQADATGRGVLCLRKVSCAVWGITQLRVLAAVPLVLSSEPSTPASPQASLVYSALPAGAEGKWLQRKFCVLSL